jgi:gliding motility-associated-like protein
MSVDAATGCFTYTPAPNYVGKDTACIIVCNNGVCDTTLIPITVTPKKDTLPIVTPEGQPIKVCKPTITDMGPGATMTTCSGTTTTSYGTMSVDAATGCFTYTPAPNYVGKDTACIIVCNNGVCDTTLIPITVTPKKDTLPIVTPEGQPIKVCKPTITDMGPGATMTTCSGTTTTSHGTMSVDAATGCFTYTPAPNYVGNDTACIIVCNNGVCDTTLITITVTPKKDTLPIVTPQNKPITVCKPTITDMGPGATMTTCSGTTTTSHGKMVLNAITGCFTYLPDSNYVGKDTGCIIVCKNGICDTTIVPIEVTSISITPKIDLRKTVESIEIQPDGNYLIRFKIKATNPMSFNVDSVTIQDDLTKVFPSVNDFSVATVTASGTLEKNGLYNGVGVIDLVTPASTLGAGKSDSVYLSVIVMPSAAGKQLNNVAIIQGKTPFGKVVQPSDDPSVNPTDTSGTTNRDATPFIIPASEVIIPGGFSPNKDGTDDAYRITAPAGSTVALIVYNRWGNKVFQSDDYKNDWRGEGPGTVWGDYVPMGTYYYIVSVKYTSGEVKKFSGPLTLVR